MRAILIHLVNTLVQALLLYVAYRLCLKLFERAFVDSARYGQSGAMVPWSLLSDQSRPRQYCLPAHASDNS